MFVREMSNEECRGLLARLGFGRLATVNQNQPYIVPIYFGYRDEHLYGFTTFGRKVEWMRANPLASVEVDEVVSHFHWSSVVVLGLYQELPDTPRYRDLRLEAQLLLEKKALWWQTAYAVNQARGGSYPVDALFYRIRINEITGRKAMPDTVESSVGLSSAARPAREE